MAESFGIVPAPGKGGRGGSGSPPGPFRLPEWAPWGLGGVVLALGLAVWELFPPGIWHDDGVYVLLGRSLAQGEGLRYLGVVGDPPAPKFPPLFPLLLAGVWRLAPSFPENAPLLAGLNLLLLSLCAPLFALYLRRSLGLSLPLALGVTSLAWISTELWRVALVPLSEPLFLLALVLALWAGSWAEGARGGRRWGALALFLVASGAAFYTRTLGAGILLGGAGALLLRGWRRGGVTMAAGGALLALPWLLWSREAATAIPAPLRDTLGPYGGWWMRQAAEEPMAYLAFLPSNLIHLLGRGAVLLLPGVRGPALWAGLLLLLPVVLLGLRAAARRTLTLPLALGLSFLVLALWPFQDLRLLVPFQPLLVLGAVLGFRELPRCWEEGRARGRAIRVAGGAWVLLFLVVSGARLQAGWPGFPYRVQEEALSRAVRAVEAKTGPEAVVGAPELWPGIHLFTGRKVAPSAPFRPLAREGPSWGTPEAQYQVWAAAGLTHILTEQGGRIHGPALDRLDALCSPGTVELLAVQPGQYLVALRWDEACRRRVAGLP